MPAYGLIGIHTVIIEIWLHTCMAVIVDADV